MKANLVRMMSALGILGLGLCAASAQESEVEQLRKEMREMRKHMQELEQKLETLEKAKTPVQPPPVTNVVPPPEPIATPPPVKAWSPTDPIRIGKSSAYADLSLVGTFAVGGSTASDIEGGTQLGGHDPNQRGFTVQGVELNLQGAVDPYFRGNANIAYQIDSHGESFLELEEGWMETTSLPGNLQLRAGQILTDFGRNNTQHPHSWGFVDAPLVSARLLGGDGIRNPGARLSWLAPTPWYTELFFTVQNSQGETAFSFRDDHEGEPYLGRLHDQSRVKSFGDLLYTPRIATSFDLTDNQTLVAGASAAFGPNGSGPKANTQIYGTDLYWKWKPANAHAGFPFVSWQTEVMLRRYRAGAFSEDLNSNGILDPGEPDLNGDGIIDSVPREMLTDWGAYSQVLWGFRKGWVAGLRGDYVTRADRGAYESVFGADPERAARWRISPNLTWYPSEFTKIRLQYNFDERQGIGTAHSVWLQFEFLLGAHAAHKF